MLRDVLNRAASGFDRAVSRAILGRSASARSRSRAESLGHDERVDALRAIAEVWSETHEHRLFAEPPVAAPALSRVRARDASGVEVFDATWPSSFDPFDASVAERYRERHENHI